MVYRRTPNVTRKLNARHEAIMAAAKSLAAEGGMNAVQIAPIAAKTGIAAGTVYRYFPSKINLVEALVEVLTEAELSALAAAVKRAPGPLSALTAALSTLAVRALQNRKIMVALLVEPVEPDMEAARSSFRQALLAELVRRVEAAMAAGHLPLQNVAVTTPALLGALRDGLIGPDAREPDTSGAARDLIQTVTLLCLRALGIVDARARGLVVQADLSAVE